MSLFFFSLKLLLVGYNLILMRAFSQAKTPQLIALPISCARTRHDRTQQLARYSRPRRPPTATFLPPITIPKCLHYPMSSRSVVARTSFQIQTLHPSSSSSPGAAAAASGEKRPRLFRTSPRMWMLMWKLAPCKVVVTVTVVAVVEEVTLAILSRRPAGCPSRMTMRRHGYRSVGSRTAGGRLSGIPVIVRARDRHLRVRRRAGSPRD